MIVRDFSKIKNIVFKKNDILNSDAEKNLLELFKKINDSKDRLYALRDKVRDEEDNIKSLEKKLEEIMPLIENIEYETYDMKEVEKGKAAWVICKTDINKHVQ